LSLSSNLPSLSSTRTLSPVLCLSFYCPFLFFFFFSRSGSPRHLPSFPTRRSSDLRHYCHWCDLRDLVGLPGSVGGLHDGLRNREDRKSTRLNSSHVKISYAVFCLKKKTKDEEGMKVC